MTNGNPLISFDGLSKPATVLIEKISDAIGGAFKPFQIIRVAKAEAEAEVIRAESKIEVTDLHRRAMRRFLEEEAKKQNNIEEITRNAIPDLKEDSKPENIEEDWITNFFDKCRIISDGDMQTLWSRVLAGEANAPGSYSKRTVNLLSSLDKKDAAMFTELCTFGWQFDEYAILVGWYGAEVYKKHGITFSSLSHLETIGLIQFDYHGNYALEGFPKKMLTSYFGTPTTLEFAKDEGNEIRIGHVLLTQCGRELARISGAVPDASFYEYMVKQWKAEKYIREETADQPAKTDPSPPAAKE